MTKADKPDHSSVILYGVWQPMRGWLKAVKQTGQLVPFATPNLDIARSTAYRLGHKARVEYIDEAIAALESDFLQRESELAELRRLGWRKRMMNLWHTLTNSLH